MSKISISISETNEIEAKRILLCLSQAPDLEIVDIQNIQLSANGYMATLTVSDTIKVNEEEL